MIIFWPTSKAHNSNVLYPNQTFGTSKRQYSSRPLERNVERYNLMSDLGDVAISKKLSILSQLTRINFWRLNFLKHYFQKFNFFKTFQKIIEKNQKKFRKRFKKTFQKKFWFFWKIYHWKKLFCIVFENCFQKMKSLKIDQWQLWYDFLGQLQRPITRMCCTQTKHLIPVNDSTHQYLAIQIWSD